MKTNLLPGKITALKAVTYDVESLVEIISNDNSIETQEVTLEMIMERVGEWASGDLNESRDDLIIFQDENGGVLEL